MKLLWVLILAVVAGGVTLAVLPSRPATPTPPAGEPRAARSRETAPVPAPSPAESAKAADAAAKGPAAPPVVVPAPSPPPPSEAPSATPAGPAHALETKPAEVKPEAGKPVETKPAEVKPAETKPVDPAPPTSPPPAAPTPSATPGAEAFIIPEHPVFNGAKIMPSKAERRPDGTLVLDGRFGLKGSGTQADPYRVSWDLLLSAHETYKPRMGQTKVPQRIVMLDGKHVIITGFTAFPLDALDPKDMLVMLNQWDGCCIGVPPTPYDAVEVKLAGNPTERMKVADHGTISGRFKLDPYEDGGWLLGLYIIEQAKFDPGKEGGTPDSPVP